MYLKDRGKWEKQKEGAGESDSINISLPLLQLLASRYRDTHELIVAMEWTLTLTFNEAGSQNADKNIQVKNEASSKRKKKKSCAGFSTSQLQASKDPTLNNTADAAPIYKDRYNRHC